MDANGLRKSGRLNEAYAAALVELQRAPDDIWAKRAMAWVLYDFAKQNTALERQPQFLRCLDQVVKLQMPMDEQIFYQCLGILIRCVVRKNVNSSQPSIAFFDELLIRVMQLPLQKPSDFYSGLMQTFIKAKLVWPQFGEFVEWWDVENLQPQDFVGQPLPDGHADFPLAEKVGMAYSKWLLSSLDYGKIEKWLLWLESVSARYPNYQYFPYYQARLLLVIRANERAVEALRPFVKRKASEFWVWELLGDAETDAERKFALYCKAMLCKNKEEMLVALREKMVTQLVERELFAEAKYEIGKVMAVRQGHGWRVSAIITNYIQSSWYKRVNAVNSNDAMYQAKSADVVKELGIKTATKRRSGPSHDNRSGEERKLFEGELRKHATGFAFAGGVYVPAFLAEKIAEGVRVSGVAVKSFDKKKQQWGWKAERLQEVK